MTMRLRSIPVLFLCTAVCAAAAFGQSLPVLTDRDAVYRSCDSVMTEVAAALRTYRSVAVTAADDTFSRFYTPVMLHGLAGSGMTVIADAGAAEAQVVLRTRRIAIVHGEVFTASLFGERLTERTVTWELETAVTPNAPAGALKAFRFSRSAVDTVRYRDALPAPDGSVPTTSYIPPELPFLYSILEPVIVTVASGVAIYLFFTIRS